MKKNAGESAASRLFIQSSSQPSEVQRWLCNSAIAFAMLAGLAWAPATVSAQQPESMQQTGHRVALIDIHYILENLPAIKAQVNKIKRDLEKEKAELKQKRDTLKQAVEQLKKLKIGSADYAKQEEHVANLDSALRLGRVHKHREMGEAEAKVYYDNYRRIAAAVRVIATRNNIKLVLRWNSKDMDPEQNDSVIRGVMKNVVYHDSAIDITDTVMRYLQERTDTSQIAPRRR